MNGQKDGRIALIHTRIWKHPEDDALLIHKNRIEKTGCSDELASMADTVIDLQGIMTFPGFHDTHLHLRMTGQALGCADLSGCTSMEQIIDSLRQQKTPVIHGMGWNQENLDEKRMPDANDLDQVCIDRPVIAERTCTHILSANHAAMKAAGLYHKDGIFTEDDCIPFLRLIEEKDEDLIERAVDHCLKRGLTCVQPADLKGPVYRDLLPVYEKMSDRIRIHHQVPITDEQEMREFLEYSRAFENDRHTFGAFKGFADGALGGRTAWLKEPYADAPETAGEQTMSAEEMKTFVAAAKKLGRPAIFHAIGDGAIEAVLDAFEEHQDENNSLNFGILHVQITDEELLERISRQKILAYIQPVFWKADAPVAAKRVGEQKAKTSYAFGRLFRTTLAPLGTDCPIEDCDPIENIYYAMHCQDPLSLEEAVDGYTTAAARSIGKENELGKIEPGYLADLTFMQGDPDDPAHWKPAGTMTDGRMTHLLLSIENRQSLALDLQN